MRLPDFVIIGAMKAGTTSLYRGLAHHPDIWLPKRKEPNFFGRRWAKGVGWYSKLYSKCPEGKITGEGSTHNTKAMVFPNIPPRMASVIPDAKIVYLVRDPVERLLSHYHWWRSRGRDIGPRVRERRNINKILEKAIQGKRVESHLINVSRYGYHLQRYLQFYNPEQIFLIQSERFLQDTQSTLNGLFKFLQVRPYWTAGFARRRNVTKKKKATIIDIDPAIFEYLKKIFQPEVGFLRRFSGMDFSGWCV